MPAALKLTNSKIAQVQSYDDLITTQVFILDTYRMRSLSVQTVIDVNTPAALAAASTDVDTTANTITEAAHGYTTGLKGQFTTSGGLPAGISASTDYFLIVVDANTYKVATSLANALAGTAVDITTQGTGNHTFTPTAIAATIQYRWSNIESVLASTYTYAAGDWVSIASATTISADATDSIQVVDPEYRALAVVMALTAGRMSTDSYIVAESR